MVFVAPGPLTSIQTLAVVVAWTQSRPYTAARAQKSPWPWVAAQDIQISMALVAAWLSDTNMDSGV